MGDKVTVTEAIAMLAEIFEEDEADINLDSSREDIEGWDSLGVLSLMAEFDSRFDILLSSDALDALSSVNDVIALLRANGALVEE